MIADLAWVGSLGVLKDNRLLSSFACAASLNEALGPGSSIHECRGRRLNVAACRSRRRHRVSTVWPRHSRMKGATAGMRWREGKRLSKSGPASS
eukprot:3162559-Pleurochrysis_carterae.AAC.1